VNPEQRLASIVVALRSAGLACLVMGGHAARFYGVQRTKIDFDFQIGRLPDGREEWLEFWRENHLLPPFVHLLARREEGEYGGHILPFLSLPDLIRSKETERVSDWQDIDLLEEILDARHRGRLTAGELSARAAVETVRTRVGLEALHQGGWLRDQAVEASALSQAAHPATQALLLPFAPATPLLNSSRQMEKCRWQARSFRV
jgi:hypothetical protein